MTYDTSTRESDYRGAGWHNWANLILGVWLFISPWVLQFGANVPAEPVATGANATAAVSAAARNAWISAIAVVIVAATALSRMSFWPERANVLLGIWIFVAPWVLGFAWGVPNANWDHWIVGALIFLISVSAVLNIGPERRIPGADVPPRPVNRR